MPIKPAQCLLVAIFATNVRRRRLELGLSQEQLAERAGVHRTYVGMLERGEKNVTIYNIDRLALALQVEPASLLQKQTAPTEKHKKLSKTAPTMQQ